MLEVEVKTSGFMILSILLLWHVHLLAFWTFSLYPLASWAPVGFSLVWNVMWCKYSSLIVSLQMRFAAKLSVVKKLQTNQVNQQDVP